MAPRPKVSDEELAELIRQVGVNTAAARLGMNARSLAKRRAKLEARIDRPVRRFEMAAHHPERLHAEIDSGCIVIGSDAHYWPQIVSTAHRAFVRFIKEMKPAMVVMNGDAFDGAGVSRHPRMDYAEIPSVKDELEAVRDRLAEIQAAAGKARLVWPIGNHDERFEGRLAHVAPEYAGTLPSLKDHFPHWEPCYAIWVNDAVVIMHRWKGGAHATHNNAAQSGKSVFTGHLHSQKVTPWTDYNGTRYGVDSGVLAAPYGPQFKYMRDMPRNWRSGFAVATFDKGRLLLPELVHVLDETAGEVEWRGKVYTV